MAYTDANPQAEDPGSEATLIPTLLSWIGSRWLASATVSFGFLGLGFVDARLIYLLGQSSPLRAVTIAERLEIDPGAVSRSVRSLVDKDLVQVEPNRRFGLTETGWDRWNRISAILEERNRRLTDGLSAPERRSLLDYLNRLKLNMSHVARLSDDLAADQ